MNPLALIFSAACLLAFSCTSGRAQFAAPPVLLTPAMTGNSAPAPYAITASSTNAVHSPWYAFDQKLGTSINSDDGWESAASAFNAEGYLNQWIQIDLGAVHTLANYTIRSRGVWTAGVSQAPMDWTLQVSTDGQNYTTIDTRAGVTWPVDDSVNVPRSFTVTPTSCRYVRLVVTRVFMAFSGGTGGSTSVGIGEIELYGDADDTPPAATPPLMYFDTISSAIYKDQAVTGNGWAADLKDGAPVNRVEVWIDGVNRGNATLGDDRPDVPAVMGQPGWLKSGFHFNISTSNLNLTLGQHTVQLRAFNNAGLSVTADKTFRIYDLSAIDPATGLPVGLTQDSNNNGIPDLIEINLGLDPAQNNNASPALQNIKRDYRYDPNDRLITAPERTYQLDAEGNIKGN